MHIESSAAGQYRRVAASGKSDAGLGLELPEGRVYGCERSLSNFRSPGMLLKRSFDVTVSASVLIVMAPVIGLIALAIKAGSRGPVFHNVFRTGMGFRVFKVYGFRTMKAGAQRMEENLTHIRGCAGGPDAAMHAPTKLGLSLKATGLDMLPMFLNVLVGDLSLVGNRPLPIQEASRFVDDRSGARFDVPAGIWGPLGRNDMKIDPMNGEEILRAELRYARNRHFGHDLGILWKVLGSRVKREKMPLDVQGLKRA